MQTQTETITWMKWPECKKKIRNKTYLVYVKDYYFDIDIFSWKNKQFYNDNCYLKPDNVIAIAELPKGWKE